MQVTAGLNAVRERPVAVGLGRVPRSGGDRPSAAVRLVGPLAVLVAGGIHRNTVPSGSRLYPWRRVRRGPHGCGFARSIAHAVHRRGLFGSPSETLHSVFPINARAAHTVRGPHGVSLRRQTGSGTAYEPIAACAPRACSGAAAAWLHRDYLLDSLSADRAVALVYDATRATQRSISSSHPAARPSWSGFTSAVVAAESARAKLFIRTGAPQAVPGCRDRGERLGALPCAPYSVQRDGAARHRALDGD